MPHARPVSLMVGLALLTLVGGSLVMVPPCVFQQDGAGEACGLDLVYWWPLVMLVVGALGTGALGAAQRGRRLPTWLGVCVGSAGGLPALVWIVEPAMEAWLGPAATDPVVIGGLLIILDAGIIYASRRLILR